MSKRDHGYYTQDPRTGVEYQVWHEGVDGTHMIGTTPDGKNFDAHYPGDGSQYGTDSKGNSWYVPSNR